MNDKYKQAKKALLDFIIRVAHGQTASDKEVEVLPEVIKCIFGIEN